MLDRGVPDVSAEGRPRDPAMEQLVGEVEVTAASWLALKLLAGSGELVAITPRSFMNGSCLRPFRQALSQALAFRRIHVRDAAFAGWVTWWAVRDSNPGPAD